jgi:hypothetical protein
LVHHLADPNGLVVAEEVGHRLLDRHLVAVVGEAGRLPVDRHPAHLGVVAVAAGRTSNLPQEETRHRQ